MIAPLRKRHRRTVSALAVLVPALYVLALAARPDPPVVDALPPALADPTPGEVLSDYGALFTGQAIAARLRGDGAARWVELEPREPVARPEVLVYWAPGSEGGYDRLGDGAVLLGALAGARPRAYPLPDAALGRDGRLVLYSLGHQEVVDSAPLPAVTAPSVGTPAPEVASGIEAETGEVSAEDPSPEDPS